MSELSENCIKLLSTTTGVDMSEDTGDVTPVALYTVPSGKTALITHIVVRNPSASLSSCTSVAFGTVTPYTNIFSALSFTTMTTASTDFLVAPITRVKSTIAVAGTTVYMMITTGSTAAATATIDVFGYLY